MAVLNCPVPNWIDRFRNVFELIFGSSIEIKVDPADLLEAAEQVNNKIHMMQNRMEAVSYTMRNMERYWSGQVFDGRKNQFGFQIGQMLQILTAMSIYSAKLQAIARTYINAEENNQETAETLPANVIN
ncbi:MAG: hypothetical protein IJA62_03925 [Ruminococcus sp.]|nr:hypothetical protein [Ruminococcus sp.]